VLLRLDDMSAPVPNEKPGGSVGVAGGAGAPGTGSSALSKKIQKALALRVDAQSREALKCLSIFFDENTVNSRRNLRPLIEGQSLALHKEFVASFDGIEQQIESLDKLVEELDSCCERAASQLQKSKTETQAIWQQALKLRQESQVIEQKQLVLDKFLSKFQVSPLDTQLLKSGDSAIDEKFFSAFERLERVRANARQMLTSSGQQTSGVDILHETSEIMEASYEKIFVWVQQQCRGSRTNAVVKASHELDTPAGMTLKRALALLVERPVYFNHCIQDISRARRQALVQRFFEALSQGDSPIELQACDPVRYVGDMLAWIHENVAFEKEAISTMMGKARAKDTIDNAESGTALVSFDDVLDRTLEGLVSPFTNRVRQVLDNQTAIVLVYKVAQVFSFFGKTLQQLLSTDGSCLVRLCLEFHERTQRSFLDMWEGQAQRLRQGLAGVYVSDLSAPAFVIESVRTLSEVLSIYESALVPTEEREVDFLPILSAAFDPLLNHCQQVASAMDAADGQVFLVNCVSAMQEPLRKHDFTAQRVAMYASVLDEQIELLVEGQAAGVLTKMGLAERLQALRSKDPGVPLTSMAEFHSVSLSATLRSFYNALFTLGGALALPLLERITNRSLRSEARSGVNRQIASAYDELYDGIKELGIATHTPEQVRTLLE